MEANYSEVQLRSTIIKQEVLGMTIYYSLVKKQGRTISILSNERLLILNMKLGTLFYINQYKNTPFKDKMPVPKNKEQADLAVSIVKKIEKSPDLQVKFTAKNQKNELITVEWTFICENQVLSSQWMDLIQKSKVQKMDAKMGTKGNQVFVHDALSYGLMSNLPKQEVRQSIIKVDDRHVKAEEPPAQVSKSKIKVPSAQQPEKPIQSSFLVKSAMKQNEKSRFIQSQSNLKPETQSNIKNTQNQPNVVESRIIQSKTKIDPKPIIDTKPKPSIDPKSKPQTSSLNIQNDWNYKFLKNPSELTLIEFQKAAEKGFMAILQKDAKSIEDPKRIYESEGLKVTVCNSFSRESTMLKREFRNYHFVLESSRNRMVVGVPLTCLIEYEGVTALVKSRFPAVQELHFSRDILLQIKDLQRYTRIANGILEKCTLYDLTQAYGSNGEGKLIYLDNLVEYLPVNVDQSYPNTSVRPEYILDNVNQLIPGGEAKNLSKLEFKTVSTVCGGIDKCWKELAAYLSAQDAGFVDTLELKEIFHSYGVNLKYLNKVYSEVTNKLVKKYIQTAMVAKVAKDHIMQSIAIAKREDPTFPSKRVAQQALRLLVEGNNSNSSQIWKEIALRFKKTYSMPISMSQIVGGFFVNSLMKLLKGQYDLTKLNKQKKIFKQQGVLSPGFIISLGPKTKTYNRFTTELVEKVRYSCRQQKKSEHVYDQIVDELKLKNGQIPQQFYLNNGQESILQYLSFYAAPGNIDSSAPLQQIPIYQSLNREPPSSFSLKITKHYLQWCNKKDKGDEFKRIIERAISLIDYWLDENHMAHCELFQSLSDHYAQIGNNDESINYMKESLSICIRSCGAQSKQAGFKYYELADRQLRTGRKKQALENFQKAKINMESNQAVSLKYPLLLMRLSSLFLNNGNVEGCIEHSMAAIKQFEEYEKKTNNLGIFNEHYKIKTFQILSRAYQISGKKNQFREMAVLCAKKFNRAKNPLVFEQMIRICITALIFKHPQDKCLSFLTILERIKKDADQIQQPNKCLEDLMAMTQQLVVMEKFINKFDNLQRVTSQMASKKSISSDSKEFITITKLVTGCVGEDYIQGLIHQKQYE